MCFFRAPQSGGGDSDILLIACVVVLFVLLAAITTVVIYRFRRGLKVVRIEMLVCSQCMLICM